MRKNFIFLLTMIMGAGVANAQDCIQFFPASEGSILTTKTYDSGDNLQNTMIYRVNNVSDNAVNNYMEIGFTLMDNDDTAVSNANIEASCNNGVFNLKMVSKGYAPEMVRAMTTNTELIGYFLNYPNVFNSDPFSNSPFAMDGGEFTIEDNSDRKDKVRVRVYNRQLEGQERVITPARNDSFNAYKITFNFDVTIDGETLELKGKEWYAPNYGIVRSETYDKNDNLINKTELSTLRLM
ncbi:MAG: hypothetical protein LUH22_15500 [Bacteroides sp.]|nr:hypothetical protein [Bacteroides sp.]